MAVHLLPENLEYNDLNILLLIIPQGEDLAAADQQFPRNYIPSLFNN